MYDDDEGKLVEPIDYNENAYSCNLGGVWYHFPTKGEMFMARARYKTGQPPVQKTTDLMGREVPFISK